MSLNVGIGRSVRSVKTPLQSEEKLGKANEELRDREMLDLCR
jgi:hypothetical protein